VLSTIPDSLRLAQLDSAARDQRDDPLHPAALRKIIAARVEAAFDALWTAYSFRMMAFP
jgi:hypothetical protein